MKKSIKSVILLSLVFLGFVSASRAQVVGLPCPPNSDFEMGNYSVWNYYVGSCCTGGGTGTVHTPLLTTTPPAATYIPCSFALTGLVAGGSVAVTGIDPFGGFPVVGAGAYSLRVGSNRTYQWANRAEYYVHVPAGLTAYSLIYRYAVVLEDPGHPPSEEPRFVVTATDSNTSTILPCADFNYVANSLPGFIGPVSNAFAAVPAYGCAHQAGYGIGGAPSDVHYKPWATTSINLSGYGGHTIIMDFTSGDCEPSGHFGYGYVDMTCGTFAINTIGCGDTIATVSAPSGFANYSWYDSVTFTHLYGTTQTVTFPLPSTATTYAVIMTPYAGFGCPDTLYTHIQPSNLQLKPGNDTIICNGQSATLTTGATDVALPLTYYWAPSTGLNCATCATPVATPFAGVNVYTFTVTDAAGCNLTDSVKVTVDSVQATIANTSPSCFGYANGSATVTPTTGTAPFVYSWSTVPSQTSSVATHLAIGTYIDTFKDIRGCWDTISTAVTQPPPLTMSISAFTNPTTCWGNDGTITLSGLAASTTYTVSYRFDSVYIDTAFSTWQEVIVTSPVLHYDTITTLTSTSLGVVVLPNLYAGTYDSITIITSGCPYNIVGPVTLVNPPFPALPFVSSNSPICDSTTLQLTTSDVTTGVTYSWSGPNGFSTTNQVDSITYAQYPDSGYYVVTATVNNCISKDSAKVIVKRLPRPVPSSNTALCSGDTLRLTGGYVAADSASSFLWGGPNGFASNLQDPIIPNVTLAASGTYSLVITYNGCTAIDSTPVVINQTPAAPIVTDTSYCQFTNPVPAISATGTNLMWYTSMGSLPGSSVAPTPSTQDIGTTTWYVTQTSATTPPCTSVMAPLTVGVFTLPHPTFTVSDSVFCNGTYFTFTVNGANTGSDYSGITWYFGANDSVQNINPIVHAFDGAGPTTVTANLYYKVCPDTILAHSIMVYPYPVLSLGADTSICPGGDPIIITDGLNITNPGAKWQWSTGDTLPSLTVVAPGVYYCKVTVNGCSTSDTVNVLNNCYMDIPNVFTPNGDGVNDYFFPRQFLTKGLITFNMTIYNRWGQVVFTTSSTDGRGWDGTFNGVPQPEGVFVYVINATFEDGQKQHRQGNITLLR